MTSALSVIAVGKFAVEFGNPKLFALVKLILSSTRFEHFTRKIFRAVHFDCFAEESIYFRVFGKLLFKRARGLPDVIFAVDSICVT